MKHSDIEDLMRSIRTYIDEESTDEIPFVSPEKIVDKFTGVTNFHDYTYSKEDVEQTCNEMIEKESIENVSLEDWLHYNSNKDKTGR